MKEYRNFYILFMALYDFNSPSYKVLILLNGIEGVAIHFCKRSNISKHITHVRSLTGGPSSLIESSRISKKPYFNLVLNFILCNNK